MFATREEARLFAERHAQAITPGGITLKWEDANEAAVLATQLGDYLIVPLGED